MVHVGRGETTTFELTFESRNAASKGTWFNNSDVLDLFIWEFANAHGYTGQ